MVVPARLNPFRVQNLEYLRYRFLEQTRDQILGRLECQGFRGEIVGPEGSGKTLLLHELLQNLSELGISTRLLTLKARSRGNNLRAVWAALRSLDSQTVLALDGAEQLDAISWFLLKLFAKRSKGLLITTHNPGRLPCLCRCITTPALLRDLAADLLGREQGLSIMKATELYKLYGGNIRAALLHCYDTLSC